MVVSRSGISSDYPVHRKAVTSILTAVILVTIAVLIGSVAVNFIKSIASSQDELMKKDIESRLENFEEKYVSINDAHNCRAMQSSVQREFISTMNLGTSGVVIATDHLDIIYGNRILSAIESLIGGGTDVYIKGPVTMDLESQIGSVRFSDLMGDSDFHIVHNPDIKNNYLIINDGVPPYRFFGFDVSECGGGHFMTDIYEIRDNALKSQILSNYPFSGNDASGLRGQLRALSEIKAHNTIMSDMESKIDSSVSDIVFYSDHLEMLADGAMLDSVIDALDRDVDVTFVGNLSDLFASRR